MDADLTEFAQYSHAVTSGRVVTERFIHQDVIAVAKFSRKGAALINLIGVVSVMFYAI